MHNFCTYTVLVTAETRQKHIKEYFKVTVGESGFNNKNYAI